MSATLHFSKGDRVAVHDGQRWRPATVRARSFDALSVEGVHQGVYWTRSIKSKDVASTVRLVRVVGATG